MDKNKIVTILVAIGWIAVVVLEWLDVINMKQYRILLLILLVFYALFFYRNRIFKKK